MNSESDHRIAFLLDGPWATRGGETREILKKPTKQKAVEESQVRLRRILRPHWGAAIKMKEGLIRDSFDETLTQYQLFELAVESGYISITEIKELVTKDFSRLLWSDGARSYLETYNYNGVVYLAQRAGVDIGFAPVELPPVIKGTEGTFAAFLSQHRQWYEDPLLDNWLGFLDDYQILHRARTDKAILYDFLKNPHCEFDEEAMLWGFIAGAERFLTRLSDLYQLVPGKDERQPYAAFYSYWLAKFYGHNLTPEGFRREKSLPDWSTVLLSSQRIGRMDQNLKTVVGRKPPSMLEFLSRLNANVMSLWGEVKSVTLVKTKLRDARPRSE
jgi:hypothetical protein